MLYIHSIVAYNENRWVFNFHLNWATLCRHCVHWRTEAGRLLDDCQTWDLCEFVSYLISTFMKRRSH